MIQVLLVDDEIAVTRALQCGIKWADLGLSIAGIATSGSQALEYIHNQPIDIVITDIRMSSMDGLSLSQQIYQMNRNIQVIIVSGFAEFSYAQKAMSYGVVGYCLKPIEYSELTRYLRLAIQRLGKSDYDNSFNCDDLLDAMYQGRIGEIRSHLEMIGFFSEQYYVGASVSKAPLIQSSKTILSLPLGYKRYGYISTDPFDRHTLSNNFVSAACQGFSYHRGSCGLPDLNAVIKRASNASFLFFFRPERIEFDDDKDIHRLPRARQLNQQLIEKDTAAIIATLKQICQSPVESLSLRAAWNLYNIIVENDVYGPLISVYELYTPEQMVFKFGTFQNMIDTFISLLEQTPTTVQSPRISNSAFLHMLRYIDQHLSEGCSLQQLANEMDMNPNYLGQVFKRETGKNYTTYVTELRIERAKNLLDDPNRSIGDVAASLGYNDYFYFLKTFKRVTGVTPKQYRSNNCKAFSQI